MFQLPRARSKHWVVCPNCRVRRLMVFSRITTGVCKRCSGRRLYLSITNEARREIALKLAANLTAAQRSENARKANATRSPEGRRESALKALACITPEHRKGNARHLQSLTPEERSSRTRKANYSRTPEQRREFSRRGNAAQSAMKLLMVSMKLKEMIADE